MHTRIVILSEAKDLASISINVQGKVLRFAQDDEVYLVNHEPRRDTRRLTVAGWPNAPRFPPTTGV